MVLVIDKFTTFSLIFQKLKQKQEKMLQSIPSTIIKKLLECPSYNFPFLFNHLSQ